VEHSWRALPVFAEKPPEFLDAVERYLNELGTLSNQERHDLAMFKAAELVNALIQILERKQSSDGVGPQLAQASFALVRAVIRDRKMVLVGGEIIHLQSPPVRAVIDEGCRLFHVGKNDPDVYQTALALSAAQCIALNDQLEGALQRYASGCGLDLPASLLHSVRSLFIERYRSG